MYFICIEIDRSKPTWFKFEAKMDFICIEIDRATKWSMLMKKSAYSVNISIILPPGFGSPLSSQDSEVHQQLWVRLLGNSAVLLHK